MMDNKFRARSCAGRKAESISGGVEKMGATLAPASRDVNRLLAGVWRSSGAKFPNTVLGVDTVVWIN